jgi:hypothetical protein
LLLVAISKNPNFFLFNPLINNIYLKFNKRMQMINIILKKHRKQRFYVIFLNNGLTLLITNNWRHKMKGLQLKVQLLKKHMMGFFSSDFFKKEKNNPKPQQLPL